jgi:hypothetical protein
MAPAWPHGVTALLSAAMVLLVLGTASAESVVQERLSLRPQKEPAGCVGSGSCPLVAGPRVNHRRSTIPGISNPDHGRPPVIVIQPLAKPATPGFRSFGGHYGIFGNP